MLLQSYLAFFHERLPDVVTRSTDFLAVLVCLRLGQEEAENNDQDRRACTKPEELDCLISKLSWVLSAV